MAGITNPLKEIDIFEPYDPFTYKELHHLDALLGKPGLAPRLLAEGQLARDGDHPTCPSGGLLGVGKPNSSGWFDESRRALLAAFRQSR
jgi:acetyl-CoA C-acetyltransferase